MLRTSAATFAFVLAVTLTACGGDDTPPLGVDASIDGGGAVDFGSVDGRIVCTSDVSCNDGLFCNGREMCAPASPMADVNGCVPGDAPCSDGETCDETENDCRVTCEDVDGDGRDAVACGGDDCDDTDASRFPGNDEVCDTDDEDCNDATFGFVDADGDGVSSVACCNAGACGADCNDANADIRPGALDGPPDACNTIDDDCDGSVDEGCPCTTGTETPCYTGAPSTRGVGRCADGFQLCVGGMLQTTCNDQRLPDTEICDTLDNDCDGMTNEDVLRRYYRDGDGDGFGIATETIEACSPPTGFVSAANDCNDDDNNRNPGAFDGCNGVDDDCDGMTDEGAPPRVFHRDADGDGFGSTAAAMMMSACDPPAGYVVDGTDCDDASNATNPAAFERCDGANNDCDTMTDEGCSCVDGTSIPCDVVSVGVCRPGRQLCVAGSQGACLGSVRAGTETCNGLDDDCDGATDELVTVSCYADSDSDGFGAGTLVTRCPESSRAAFGNCPSGYTNVAGDCNDANGAIRPMAVETCNTVDDDCDTMVDEGVRQTFYRDADGDGFGALSMPMDACTAPAGYVVLGTDCADADSARNPAATERCDGVNNDCDAMTDEGCLCTDGASMPCDVSSVGVCRPGTQICIAGAWGSCVGSVRSSTEVCNGRDDDCDGSIDELLSTTCYADADGDGRGAGLATPLCGPSVGTCPTGWSTLSDDCNDANGAISPTRAEVCNGHDDDCDGAADETFPCVQGATRAGNSAYLMCASLAGLFTCNATCTAETFTASPPPESCDAIDNNCNGVADDGFTCVRSSTGNPCTTSCGTVGAYTCSATCTTGTCRAAAETCNGCDDDGTGGVDNGFACALGATRACTTACGTAGTQRCLGDCGGYDACRATTETCNGCDDDLDGAADEGFFCQQNRISTCTTAVCGTPGQLICNATCTAFTTSQCAAPTEYCNYCDDDKDGSFDDDRSLATGYRNERPGCPGLTMVSTIEACPGVAPGFGLELYTLLDGASSDAAAIWMPAERLGWSTMRFDAEMRLSKASAAALPADGWALVLADGGTGTLGGVGGGLGVPYTRTGLAIEWRFYNDNPSVDQIDTITVRRLTGSGSGTVIVGADRVPVPVSRDFGVGDTALTQNLVVYYTPDDPTTLPSEEQLRVATYSGGFEVTILTLVSFTSGGQLNNELAATSMVTPAMTAATGGLVFTAEAAFGSEAIFGGSLDATTVEFFGTCD